MSRANPIFKLWRGTESIDLLSRTQGWFLVDFKPKTAPLKQSSVWQSSPFLDGRQPIDFAYENIIDTWTISARAQSEDALIELSQELERFGFSALEYWTVPWSQTPVYLEMRGPTETNSRYAIIQQIQINEYGNQFAQPFFGYGRPVLDRLILTIEHGQWQNVAPGSSECVQLSSALDWAPLGWSDADTVTGDIYSMIRADNGNLLAGTSQNGRVYISTDNGVSWSLAQQLSASSNAVVYSMAKGSTGRLFLSLSVSTTGEQGIWYSDNHGSTWTRASSITQARYYSIDFGSDGSVSGLVAAYPASSTSIGIRVFDESLTTDLISDSFAGTGSLPLSVRFSSTGIVVGGQGYLLRRPAGGNLGVVQTYGSSSSLTTALLRTSTGRLLAAVDDDLYFSDEDGIEGSWSLLSAVFNTEIYDFFETGGVIYAGDNGEIAASISDGLSWYVQSENPVSQVGAFVLGDDGLFYNGAGSTIQSLQLNDRTQAGAVSTCNNAVYVVNSRCLVGLSSIKIYDASGTSFTELLPMTSFPVTLLPSTPAAGDLIYFGVRTDQNDVPYTTFSGLVFDLQTPLLGLASGSWEYWNGSTWSTLTVTDNTELLSQAGVKSVHWELPTDWTETTVDSLQGYWMRFNVASVNATVIPPVQQTRTVYTPALPYVEIAASQIGGDLSSLGKIRIENVSDTGGISGSDPKYPTNRLLLGLRSCDRGENFSAFLNIANDFPPPGLTVSLGTDSSIPSTSNWPAAGRGVWSPSTLNSWVTIFTFTLDSQLAVEYFGSFRALLRMKQYAGSFGDMIFRLSITVGSQGIAFTTEPQTPSQNVDFDLLEFGLVNIPISDYLKQVDIGDTMTIRIQGYSTSASADAYIYDLILLPVDEWAGDFIDGDLNYTSYMSNGEYLEIDSITNPKVSLRNTLRSAGSRVKSIWEQKTNGPVQLRANKKQRLWILSQGLASTTPTWNTPPELSHRVQMWSVERYRWARGSR